MKSIVVYATDENYVKLTAVSIYSLLMHNPGIDVAIFTDRISSQSASLLTGIAKRFNSIIKLRPLYRQIAAEAGFPEVAEQSRPVDFGYRMQYLAWKTLPHTLFSYACRAMYAYFFRTRYGV